MRISGGSLLNRECRMSCNMISLTGYLILQEKFVWHGGARPPLKLKTKIVFFQIQTISGGKGGGKGGSNPPARQSNGNLTSYKMTVRKVGKVELRKDDKLQKMLQRMLSQLLWPRVRLWHPILEGKGLHPSTNLQRQLLNRAATKVKYRRCKERLQNSRFRWPKKRAR